MKSWILLLTCLFIFSFTKAQFVITADFTAPYYEDFDSNFNPGTGTTNVGATIDSNWSRNNYPFTTSNSEYFWGGGTGSSSVQNTGPSSDHTTGNGNYIFAESSNYRKDRAKINTPIIDLDTLSNPQLTFWKHQFGSDIDNFSVQIVVNGFWGGTIYTSNGNKGNQWDRVTIPLNNYTGFNVGFIFIAWRNSSSPGNGLADIAIDDLSIDNAPNCPSPAAAISETSNFYSLTYSGDSSIGTGLLYTWSFGDGTSSTGSNGIHTYNTPGVYNLTLDVNDACGQTNTLTKTIFICDSTIGGFTSVQNGSVTSFDATGSVANGALQYSWDFGDGSTASGQVVTHTYLTPSTYNVTLTITNLCGFTYSVTQPVQSCIPPLADWSYVVLASGNAGLAVQFNSQNSVGAVSYLWDFGDGNTSIAANPVHLYTNPGLNYEATLTVTNDCNLTNSLKRFLGVIGVEESSLETITVSPNPTRGMVQIELANSGNDEIQLMVTDLQGQTVLNSVKSVNNNLLELDLNTLQAGMYLIHIIDGQRTVTRKVYKFN